MATTRSGTPSFPRPPLYGAAALIVLSLAAAAFGRLTGPQGMPDPAKVVVSRDLRFEDRADGAVAVYLAGDTRPLDIVSPGTNGFLRATLRGLARARRQDFAGADIPFQLTEWSDGRLTLVDPSTGRRVELAAFGITNEQAFARLLTMEPPTP